MAIKDNENRIADILSASGCSPLSCGSGLEVEKLRATRGRTRCPRSVRGSVQSGKRSFRI
jgi:hypothetical protein